MTMFDKALKYLSSRALSEKELIHCLEQEFAADPALDKAIASTLTRLRELHLINDRRIAESLAFRYRHKGNRFIQHALRQKGFTDEVIEETLAECGDEYERALEVLHKKLYSVYREPGEKSASRLYSFLASRGFSHGVKLQERGKCESQALK